jgi:hypothetical protein
MMDEIVPEVPRDITWNVHGQSNVVKAKENKKKTYDIVLSTQPHRNLLTFVAHVTNT